MSEPECLEQRRYEKEFQYLKIYVHSNLLFTSSPRTEHENMYTRDYLRLTHFAQTYMKNTRANVKYTTFQV